MTHEALSRLANWAHRQPSTFVRRGVLSLATIGLVVNTVGFWLIMPVLWIVFPIAIAVIEMAKAIGNVPSMTANQVRADAEQWRRDGPGIVRIWRAQKVEPTLIRDPRP